MNFHHKVTELLSLIYSFEGSLRSVPDQASRQLAAAGLMRCCALLEGVHALEDNKLGVISGILERAHWETWLVSIHVLFRGEQALLEIAGDDIHWKRTLSRELDLGYTYHEDWEGKLSKLNYKSLADGVKPLLIAAGESDDPDGRKGYNFTFRVQSLFAVHAGLSTFSSFLHYGEELWGLGGQLKTGNLWTRQNRQFLCGRDQSVLLRDLLGAQIGLDFSAPAARIRI